MDSRPTARTRAKVRSPDPPRIAASADGFGYYDGPGPAPRLADRTLIILMGDRGAEPEVRRALSEALLKSLFTTLETWYIEMAAERPDEAFDVFLKAQEGSLAGRFYLYRFMDAAGHFVPTESVTAAEVSESCLGLRSLKPGSLGPADAEPRHVLTLAFKVNAPAGLAVEFDLRIDRRALPDRVFIGESAKHPKAVPFSRGTRQLGARTWGATAQRPEPPYFLVWRAQGRQVAEVPAALSDDANRELRALGYIQ